MINLSLTTEEAQLVRDACIEYHHQTKHSPTERGQRLSAQVREIGKQLADKVRLAK